MPVITDWVLAKSCTITLNGSTQRAMTARYSRQGGRVERTNLKSGGEFEGCIDIITNEFEITIAVSAAEGVPALTIGTGYSFSYVTTGGSSHSGTFILESVSESNGARGGYEVSLRGFSTGATTNS